MRVSDFNRRITMKAYSTAQTATGGLTRVLAESVSVWAKVENRSGFVSTEYAQQIWSVNLTVTIRYQAKFDSNWVFEYEGQEYRINNITPISEGYKRFMVLRSSGAEKIENWS